MPDAPLNPRTEPSAQIAASIYQLLTGFDPAEAVIDRDESFDRHILASILAVSAAEPGVVAERVGLTPDQLGDLLAQWFPMARVSPGEWWCRAPEKPEDDETAMVRELLQKQCSSDGATGQWLAAMLARRSMEPHHLWEDLGLRDRSELTRLLSRHFASLAARNTRNMRWKRFFYRMLCEDDGFVMCTTPVCTNCNDFDLCFGDESGESRMADRRRELTLLAAVPALPETPT